jgi:hypothetical protein
MMKRGYYWRGWLLLCQWLVQTALVPAVLAQTVQFSPPGGSTPFGTQPTLTPPQFNPPGATLSPPAFGTPNFAQPGYPTPGFTAPTYPAPNYPSPSFWNAPNPPLSTPVNPGFGSAAPVNPGFGNPSGLVPSATPWNPPATTGAPSSLFPNSGNWNPFSAPPANAYGLPPGPNNAGPNTLFPNGLWGPNAANGAPGGIGERFRFLQHPRVSETFLYGADEPLDLAIHDMEAAITGAIPNFLISTQPVYITPTFVLHLWDGPQGVASDLPANAYSAFLDTFWASNPDLPLGAEVGVSVGVFTDFDTINSKSLRVMGEGFGVARLTPTLTLKLGVWYLNRNDLKLLPAGGLVWQPSPQIKCDFIFPNPKLSRYLSTMGNADVWWYVAGEYGGGAWTIQRADGSGDRVDINDIRVKLGLDWMNQRNWRGFLEVGYVFEREVVYVVNPLDSFKPRDTFMAAAGFSF